MRKPASRRSLSNLLHPSGSLLLAGTLATLLAACAEELEDVDDFDPTTQMVSAERLDTGDVETPDEAGTTRPWVSLTELCGATYDDEKMQGTQNNLTRNASIAFMYRRVTAVAVAPNCTVKLKTNGGSSKNFTGTGGGTYYYNVGSDWNDRADRAECTCSVAPQLAALIYEDASYGGNSVPLWDNAYGSLAAFWNDRVTAIKVQDGSTVVLSEHSPPKGKAYTSSGGSSSNVGSSFNDLASHFVSGGTYWPGCTPVRFCSRYRNDCAGEGVFSPDMVDCFQARNYTSYCQEAVNGSVCIPRSATPL